MKIEELIAPDRVSFAHSVSSKKRALEQLSALLVKSIPNLTEEQIFESLTNRERLGSTGLGHGVAIPHARLKGRDQAIGAFLKLDVAVDFDAIDNRPVDLLFALVVPEHFSDEHLEILSQLAEMFANQKLCDQIRKSDDEGQIYRQLTHW